MLTEVKMRDLFGGRLLALSLWDEYADYAHLAEEGSEKESPIVIAAGPAAEFDHLEHPSFAIATRNPVTRRITVDRGSTDFGKAILSFGYLAVVIVGRLRRIAGITINGNGVSVTPSEELFEATTDAVAKALDTPYYLSTGVAGDRYSPYASVVAGGKNIGRGGLGAIFGRKNLKYIALYPKAVGRTIEDEKQLAKYHRLTKRQSSGSKIVQRVQQYGTLGALKEANRYGWAAIDGWRSRVDGRLWSLTEWAEEGGELDLCTALALGPNIGIFDRDAVSRLNERATSYGLDPIALSALLSWITHTRAERELPFLPPCRGDRARYFEQLLEAIAYQRGRAGVALSEALHTLVATYGGAEHAYLVDTMAIPPLDLRALPANALLVAQGDMSVVYSELLKPKRYRRGRERKIATIARAAQVLAAASETIGMDSRAFIPLTSKPLTLGKRQSFLQLAYIASIAEGRTLPIAEVIEYGQRALGMEQEINERLKTLALATLPERLLIDGTSTYPKVQVVPLTRLLMSYQLLMAKESKERRSLRRWIARRFAKSKA